MPPPQAYHGSSCDQSVLLDNIEHCERGGTADGRTAVGTAQTTWQGCVHNLGLTYDRGKRKATGNTFCHCYEVGLDPRVLRCKKLAGARKSSLDLICNQNDAVLITDLPQCL